MRRGPGLLLAHREGDPRLGDGGGGGVAAAEGGVGEVFAGLRGLPPAVSGSSAQMHAREHARGYSISLRDHHPSSNIFIAKVKGI